MSARDDQRRRLSGEEHALWETVARSVKPLKRRRRAVKLEEPVPAAKAAPARLAKPTPPPPAVAPRPKLAAPPLAPLERRLKQKVARGVAAIDARIDLHGMTQERAHRALIRFLRKAQAEEARLVLVITGKGRAAAPDASERGVLRRAVPQWLALPEFRALVIGFETAHTGHGGEGALYVRVRRGG